MKSSAGTFLAFSVLVTTLISQGTEARERAMTPLVNVTVSIFNDAGVPASVLLEAQAEAAAVMSEAGVSLVWLDCGTPGRRVPKLGCSAIAFPEHLSVRLVSKAAPSKADIFGQSFQDEAGKGSYAVVYYPGLSASKAAQTVRTGRLLGLVVAHELGHLLLGMDSHSADGLMSAVWQVPELRQATQSHLFFSRDQSDRIRVRYFAATARLVKVSESTNASSGK
jgi:hypothetical protein